jgi:hypothetical protein
MKITTTDRLTDKIVAACGGNVHGAIEVLFLLNEHLEAEIQKLHAALSSAGHERSVLPRVRH